MVCQTFASLFGLWIISGEAASTIQPCWLKIPYGLTKNSIQKVKERESGESSMVCQTFASLFELWIINGEASSTLQPCPLKIPYGLTKNSFQKVKERESDESSMVCQTFATLFGLWIISGEASSTLQPCRLKIPYGLTKNSFQEVKERAVNQAWCVRFLHHCSGCGSSVEKRRQRYSPAG